MLRILPDRTSVDVSSYHVTEIFGIDQLYARYDA